MDDLDCSPRSSQSGLTAIELAVVVAILAVLAALVGIGLAGMNQSAGDAARFTDVSEVQKAVDRWGGEQPAARYPVSTPVIVDGNDIVRPSAAPASNGLPAKGSGLYVRMAFTDTFTSPEGLTRVFIPDALQRLPKYGVEQSVPWVIDENGTVKLLGVSAGTQTPAATDTATPTPTRTVTPFATSIPMPTTQAGSAPAILGTASIPASPRLIAANSSNHRAYVAVGTSWNAATYYVSVVDGIADTADIPVGAGDYSTGPTWLAVNTTTNRVYVNHTGSNIAHTINADTNSVIGTITTGAYPEGIVTNPLTNRLYIANTNSGNVSVFDTTNDADTLLTTIAIPGSGAGITNLYLAIIPATSRIYVTAPGLNKIFVIDAGSNAVVQTWTLAWSPSAAVVADATTSRLYVASGGAVYVLNATTGATIATVPVGSAAVGYLAINPTLQRVYATSSGSNLLAVVDGASNAVVATVDIGAGGQSIAADASSGRVYVATAANTVVVLGDSP